MTCPRDDDACTDGTCCCAACPACCGAPGMGSWAHNTRANAPADLAEDRGVADHREGVAMGSMLARLDRVDTDPRRTV